MNAAGPFQARAIMPDTRLPFKGKMAFHRNTQEYIPFHTETDAMLASLMLAYRLSSPIFALVLALARHPGFNPADITLCKAEDVWLRVTEHQAPKTKTVISPKSAHARKIHFPRFVMEEVVDILAAERHQKLHDERDTYGPYPWRIDFSRIDADLKSMSLVCKEWRTPAQRALGRILAIQDVHKSQLEAIFSSPLFGKWTRESLVIRHSGSFDHRDQELLHKERHELAGVTQRLVERTPNIKTLSICVEWIEIPVENLISSGISQMPALQELRLIQSGDIAQLLGSVCMNLRCMTKLRHLYVQFSGIGSAYTTYVPPSALDEAGPGPAFEQLTLKIGSVSELALRYISWLTRPRGGEGGFRLKNLALDMSGSYYSERPVLDALAPCLRVLDTLWVNVCGLGDDVSTKLIDLCGSIRQLWLFFRHAFDHSRMPFLPDSLEELYVDFSFKTPEWEVWDECMVDFLRHRCPPKLRVFSLCPTWHKDIGELSILLPNTHAIAREKGVQIKRRYLHQEFSVL